LIDQNAAHEGIFVEFFGRLASTHAGAALFAIRTGAPVVPVFGIRHEDNTHTALILPEVEVIRTGNLKADIMANTEAFTRLVEQQIRARPEMWFWLHDRWKSRPKGEEKKAQD
jgi:KDO2-lipid IV(A) lauroyltransferase